MLQYYAQPCQYISLTKRLKGESSGLECNQQRSLLAADYFHDSTTWPKLLFRHGRISALAHPAGLRPQILRRKVASSRRRSEAQATLLSGSERGYAQRPWSAPDANRGEDTLVDESGTAKR